ncbi:diphthine synthase [candidate division MSBL1 archaeon SCGC-AAA261F17]|uniref:Diphthine synthase n=1 Tax=candidate division MSBL1 archaeon SCGC-AAA261F17 TaxID=1698274 RepID=A0A133V7U9_9EURY|nr:diphthine synthase [candidate division MSBL1 archaeon SCGC-AAA261F17]
MLIFIGLGLQEKGLTLEGLEEAQNADRTYAELYTSLIPDLDLDALSEKIGKKIKVIEREDVEEHPDEILETAKSEKVAFLVPGDPMVATTHVDLRLRAEKAGIETRIIHGASIEIAAPGLAGLQSYKFGRSATIPLPEKPSKTPYEVLVQNQEDGLHTLLLLDIEAPEERYLTANEAMEIMLDLESKGGKNVFTQETLVAVIARAGSEKPTVKAGKVGDLIDFDFGSPPHVLIVPGKLHFLEAEALQVFGGAPEEVEGYVE